MEELEERNSSCVVEVVGKERRAEEEEELKVSGLEEDEEGREEFWMLGTK